MGIPAEAPPDACELELVGNHLLFVIALVGGHVTVAAQTMDQAGSPDPLLKIEDSAGGWDVTFRLVRSLVQNEVRSFGASDSIWNDRAFGQLANRLVA